VKDAPLIDDDKQEVLVTDHNDKIGYTWRIGL